MKRKIIYYNGVLIDQHQPNKQASAVYVEDETIIAIGSTEEIKLQFGRFDVEQVDWQRHYVYPGFVDSHVHLAAYGRQLSMLDLSCASSKEHMLKMVKERVYHTPVGQWLYGFNWDENLHQNGDIPTRLELDEISKQHPIYLTRNCHHVHLANTHAFERTGVLSTDYVDVSGGALGRLQDGSFNGLIYEKAADLFTAHQPEPDQTIKKRYMKDALHRAVKYGLTAVHTEDLRELGDFQTLLNIYNELQEEGIYLRTNQLIYHPHLEELIDCGLSTGSGDSWLKVGAAKIFIDGSLGGRTALLSQEYLDDPGNHGIAIHDQDELTSLVQRAKQHNMPVAMHAIGDGAVQMAVEALNTQLQSTYHRDRLIHVQLIRQELVEQLKGLHICLDIQPGFVPSDFPWVLDKVALHKNEGLYAWNTLVQAGLYCAGSSDAPIESLDPLLGIHAAVTRRKPGEHHEGYIPNQKLNMADSLGLYTLGGAYATTEEMNRGSISAGKYADFTVLDRNLKDIDPDDLLNTSVYMTIANGKILYNRKD